MKVYNPLKLSELQDTLLKITKKHNNESSRNDKKEDNLKYLTKEINSLDSKRSLSSRHSLINLDIELHKNSFYDKEEVVRDIIIDHPITKPINTIDLKPNYVIKTNKKKNDFYRKGIEKVAKVSINEIISKLNKNSNSNQYSLFRE